MLELWTVLAPILLADVVSPVLFAFMVYAVGTDKPLSNSVAALFGHTVSYLGFGIALASAFDFIMAGLANPKPVDYVISLIVGVLLLWVAWQSRRSSKNVNKEPQIVQLTPLKAFSIGAVINVVGLPFALPYFAALDQVLKADLTIMSSIIVIAGYNLFYALPFLLVPALVIMMGDKSRPVLVRINDKVDRISAYLMPAMLLLVGIALVADAIKFFIYGEGLF